MTWPFPFAIIDGNRHRRIVELLSVLWVLSLADLFFTLWANRFAPFYEVNPIARALLRHGAIASLVVYKLALTTFGSLIFWRIRRQFRTELALWAVVGVYTLLAFQWFHFIRAAVLQAAN